MKQLDNSIIAVIALLIFCIGIITGLLIAMITLHYNNPGEASPGFPDNGNNFKSTDIFGNPNKFLS